jgi:hypothetical protein
VCVVPFVILAYLENDRLEKVVFLQQILLELEKNAMGPFKILKVAFEVLMTPSDEENKCKAREGMVPKTEESQVADILGISIQPLHTIWKVI